MIKLVEKPKKIKVNYFQRKPRQGFNFSIEFIFNDVRAKLSDRIKSKVFISSCYNQGIFTKIINIVQAALRQNKDVNHITGETHFLNMLMRKKNVILTIHDCGMVHRKTGLSKTIIKWLYIILPSRKAAIVTANSEVTKNEILNIVGLDPDKIRVIPVAVNQQLKPNTKAFNKSKPVILQIGTGYNKNINRLIEAIQPINCKLVIIGRLSEKILELLANAKIDFENRYNLSEEELLQEYHSADIISFISTFEGFGMPIVEANSIERVVITSNLSSMPEVAGNAAYLVDPYNVEEIRTGILKLINDENLRTTLIKNGRLNKLRFDGNKIADMYFELYREIVK